MRRYSNSVSSVTTGIPVYQAQIRVLKADTSAAQLYSDNGITTLSQPVLSDGTGFFSFFVADGTYTIVIADPDGSNPRSFPNTEIYEDARNVSVPVGEPGLTLPSAAARAGKVQTYDGSGNPTVTAKSDIGGTGPAGPANVLSVGTVTKVAAGGTPTVSITGTSPAQTLNVGLVTGDTGAAGGTGATGPAGYTSTDTWAHLNAITPSSGAGSTGFAVGPDTGTHTDANGATLVPNTGQFSYQASPAGWIRIGSALGPGDLSAITSQHQTIGYPGPIPDGAATQSSNEFIYFDPVLGDGTIWQVRLNARGTGTVAVRRYRQIGGVWTAQGAAVSAAVSATGYQTVALSLAVYEGDFLSITGVGVVGYTFQTGTNTYGLPDGSGMFYAGVASIPIQPDLTARIHAAIDISFRSMRAETQRNVLTIQSSDKIAWIRNSYAEDLFALRGKGYLQKVADLTDWRVENYSVSGRTNADNLTALQAREYTDGSPFSLRDINPTLVFAGEMQNSTSASGTTTATLFNNYRQLAESCKALGANLVIATDHPANLVSSTIETGPSFVRKIASDYGAYTLSFRANTQKFAPGIGGFGTDYAGWTNAPNHLNTRYNELLAQPVREFIATTIGRPRKSLRIFRPRPNSDGSAPAIASKDALLFEVDDLATRHALFMELAHGQRALSTAAEKYLDEINSGSLGAADYIISEYQTLQIGQPLAFTDYAYVEAILEANGSNVSGVGIRVSDSGATVYIRDAFYRDTANPNPSAATAPTGCWRQLLVDADGIARLTGRNITGTIWGDKVCFLIAKAGSFTLTEPYVEWYGKAGKVSVPLKPTNRPAGTELVTSPYMVAAGALASGWTATGAPTFGTGLQGMLPQGATGNAILSTANKATTTLAWTADQYRDREVEIVVWAAVPKALQVSGSWTRGTGTITPFTNDLDQLVVEIVGGSNAVPFTFAMGLYWQEVRFRTWAVAGSTGFSVRLSAGVTSVTAAYLSAKFVEP